MQTRAGGLWGPTGQTNQKGSDATPPCAKRRRRFGNLLFWYYASFPRHEGDIMSENIVCRTFPHFPCWRRYIQTFQLIWSDDERHISVLFIRFLLSPCEKGEKQTLLSFFFFRPSCLIWSVCETANGFNYGEGGREPFGRKEGKENIRLTPWSQHRRPFSDAVMAIPDFSTLDNDLPIWDPKSHLNPTQFDKASKREPILELGASSIFSEIYLSRTLFSPEAICNIGSSILHECRYFQPKLALQQNFPLFGPCIWESINIYFWQKAPPKRFPLCPGTSHIIPLEMLAHWVEIESPFLAGEEILLVLGSQKWPKDRIWK